MLGARAVATATIPGYASVRTRVCGRAQAVFYAVLDQYRSGEVHDRTLAKSIWSALDSKETKAATPKSDETPTAT